MSLAYIPSEEDLKRIVNQSVKEAITEALPTALRKANRKQWVNTTDVMHILQCSRRHVQYLRDTKQLAFTQNARTIRYRMEDVENFLNQTHIPSREKE